MGKRKERRLAAMMAAGRRVKLDLFVEPSGEILDNSLHEVGGNGQDHRAVVPTSPSSGAEFLGGRFFLIGQKQENPLLLLGQYSDEDESDEEVNKVLLSVIEESVAAAANEKVPETLDEGEVSSSKTTEINHAVDHDSLDGVKELDAGDAKGTPVSVTANQNNGSDPATQNVIHDTGMQIVGDLAENWKIVMHGESNQYYYWNFVTGETSWVIPDGLLVETSVAYANVSAADAYGVNQINAQHYGTAETEKGDAKLLSNVFPDHQKKDHLSDSGTLHAATDTANVGTTDIHSAHRVNYGLNLLQRLKALKRSAISLEEQEAFAKEINIRVSDCRALSSYGSSLLPFWWHTESQLKQLESAIEKAEASVIKENPSQREESTILASDKIASDVTGYRDTVASAAKATGQIGTPMQIPDSEILDNKGLSPEFVIQNVERVTETDSEPNAVPSTIHLEQNVDSPAEDVDMDVEMEVDEEEVTINTDTPQILYTENPALQEQAIHPSTESSGHYSVPLGESVIPPPPDEEWIPPPPPDSEPVPPPPPEEPPEPYQQPYGDAVPPSYAEQYNSGYAHPVYEYYTPVASEAVTVNYYAQADGSHIAQPLQPTYYEPVASSSFTEVVADLSTVQPITYYDISSVAPAHVPADTSTTSSGFYVESAPISYPVIASVSQNSSSSTYALESKNGESSHINVPFISSTASNVSLEATSSMSAVSSSDRTSGNDSAVLPSAATKIQSKATRNKKRTVAVAPTLRSNKKVASLVGKWKAAKEELHGEEDEPEDAYEILERKRQKEIEEWHARQIASGEAQENANFLPLGGDWRERVKRRRAGSKTERSDTPDEAVARDKNQPDLQELSKNLPSGWQAYWDESTKEVYYGNNITSETTWTRPTR